MPAYVIYLPAPPPYHILGGDQSEDTLPAGSDLSTSDLSTETPMCIAWITHLCGRPSYPPGQGHDTLRVLLRDTQRI